MRSIKLGKICLLKRRDFHNLPKIMDKLWIPRSLVEEISWYCLLFKWNFSFLKKRGKKSSGMHFWLIFLNFLLPLPLIIENSKVLWNLIVLCEIVLQIIVSQFTGSRQTQYHTTPISSLWGPRFLCEIASVKGELQLFQTSCPLAKHITMIVFFQ